MNKALKSTFKNDTSHKSETPSKSETPNKKLNEILSITGVTKSYGAHKALENINLSISAGTVVGLLGPNGSGKTTLIKIINTLINDYTGDVKICGYNPGPDSKALISYLPDAEFMRVDLNISEAIAMYGEFFADFDATKASEMLKTIKLEPKRLIKTLSKGMREKLQLVLTMSRKAKLFIFDEPIASVDPAARDFIIDTIISNFSEDSAILISTHLISDVERILDRAVFLKSGSIVLDDEAENLRAQGKSIDELFREVFKC